MGLMAPRATPAPVIARLQQAAAAALGQAEVKERLEAMGFQGAADTPEQFARFLASEIGKWAKVVKDAGIQPE
jgi:tripartite-type tricarboxylate transporter receptor subunit TctC